MGIEDILLGHRRGPTFMAILFAGTLAAGIGAAFVWRARRAQNSQS